MSYTYNNRAVHRTWLLLKITYALAPILVGADKLIGWWLGNWAQYVSPIITSYFPITLAQVVVVVGVIEIIAGILVWLHPRWGGYVVAAWLLAIIINLASMNKFYDIIARDALIAVGAIALAWLTAACES